MTIPTYDPYLNESFLKWCDMPLTHSMNFRILSFAKSYGPYNSGNMFASPVWECVINSIIKSNFEFFDKMDIHQVSLAGPTWDKGFWRNTPTLNSPKSSLYNLYSYEGFLNLEGGIFACKRGIPFTLFGCQFDCFYCDLRASFCLLYLSKQVSL